MLKLLGETMEFHHLRSFVVVAQTGNVTKAAKQLYTTPPAVSAHLKSLEEELNTQLFIRSSRGMALTEKGRLLLPKAEKTLASALDLVNHAASQQNELIGHLRIGINQPADLFGMDKILLRLRQSAPGIDTEILYGSSSDMLIKLAADQLDIAYLYGDIAEEFVVANVTPQALTLVTPSKYNLNTQSTVSDLHGLPWIDVGINCPFTALAKQHFGDNIEVITTAADDATRLSLIKAGLGLSLIEASLAKQLSNTESIVCLPQFTFDTEVKLVYKKEREGNPLIQAYLSLN